MTIGKIFCVLSFLSLSSFAYAVDLAPWYPREFEFQPELDIRTQHSNDISSTHGDSHHPLHANFLTGSLGVPYYKWYGQVEVCLAESTQRYFGSDHATVTLRYQLSDDVADASPVSAVISFSGSTVTKRALYDLSSFHHGKFEGIAQIAVGKEFSSDQFWSSRFWGVFGLGSADVGSPWFHVKLCAEKNYCDLHRLSLFADCLLGMGGNSLSRKHFHGYGSIAHRSIDLWVTYRHDFDCGLNATIGGSYRVYAYNFPKDAYSLSLSFLYPFGL
jgi:hypothetical protein